MQTVHSTGKEYVYGAQQKQRRGDAPWPQYTGKLTGDRCCRQQLASFRTIISRFPIKFEEGRRCEKATKQLVELTRTRLRHYGACGSRFHHSSKDGKDTRLQCFLPMIVGQRISVKKTYCIFIR